MSFLFSKFHCTDSSKLNILAGHIPPPRSFLKQIQAIALQCPVSKETYLSSYDAVYYFASTYKSCIFQRVVFIYNKVQVQMYSNDILHLQNHHQFQFVLAVCALPSFLLEKGLTMQPRLACRNQLDSASASCVLGLNYAPPCLACLCLLHQKRVVFQQS